jgi:hypothetical protein
MAICDRRGRRRSWPGAMCCLAPNSPTRAVAMPSASTVAALVPASSAAKNAASPTPRGETFQSAVDRANPRLAPMIEDMSMRASAAAIAFRLPAPPARPADAPACRGRRSGRRGHRVMSPSPARRRTPLRRWLVAGLAVLVAGAGVWAASGGLGKSAGRARPPRRRPARVALVAPAPVHRAKNRREPAALTTPSNPSLIFLSLSMTMTVGRVSVGKRHRLLDHPVVVVGARP